VPTTNWSRRSFLTGALGGAGLLMTPGLLAACSRTEPGGGTATGAGGTLERIKDSGVVRVGFAGEAPYGFKKDGKLTGQAPALHREIFSRLGVETLEGTLTDFGQLIPGLNADRFDVVSAGMFITPERCANAAFSEPTYVATAALMVPAGNPKGLSDFASLAEAGVQVGVLQGAVEEGYATANGVDPGKISTLGTQQDALDALLAGRIDVIALTSISLRWLARTNPDAEVEVTDSFVPVVDGEEQVGAGGAVFRSEDADLRDAFNAELAKVLADPELYTSLVGEFGFTEAEIPPEDVTTESLCPA
jgi:polar amino acid transport system substrate-binding protein